MMDILWTKRAAHDFEKEMTFLEKESPHYVKKVATRIFETLDLLKNHPELGHPGRVSGTRELFIPKTSYLVPYRVKNNKLEILRLFNVSQKPQNDW